MLDCPTTPGPARTHRNPMALLQITLLGFTVTVAYMACRVALSLLALQSGESAMTVGVLFALFSVLQIGSGIHTGRWIDRAGLRLPGISFCLLTLASMGAVFLAPGLTTLALCAAATGSLMMYNLTGLSAVAGQIGGGARRSTNIAWYMLGNSAGLTVGPLFAGFGTDLIGAHRVFGVLMLLPVLIMLQLTLWRGRPARQQAVQDGTLHAAGGASTLALARSGAVFPALVVTLFGPSTYEIFTFAVPVLGVAAGLSASQIGIVLGSGSAMALSARVFLPALARRLNAWTVAWAAYATNGVGLVALACTEGMASMLAVGLVLGLAHGVANPTLMSLYHAALPRGREAEMFGFRGVMVAGVIGLLPLAVGAIGTLIGLPPVLAVVAAGGGVLSRYAWRHGATLRGARG